MKPETDLRYDIPFDEYLELDATSKSDLDRFVSDKDKKGSGLLVGRALHTLILEGPEKAKEEYAFAPDEWDYRTILGKEARDAFQLEHPGKEILRPKERAIVKSMAAAIYSDPKAMKVIRAPGKNEATAIGRVPGFESMSKCRIDMIRKSCIVDLKSSGVANIPEFINSIVKFGYAAQAAYYTDLYAAITNEYLSFYFLVVTKGDKTDHQVEFVPITNEQLAFGRKWYTDIFKLKERWPIGQATASGG